MTPTSDELTSVTDEMALEVTADWLPKATAVDDMDDEMFVVLRLMRCTTELKLMATMLETEVLTFASDVLTALCVELMALTDVLVLLSEELIWLFDWMTPLSDELIWLADALVSLSEALIWLFDWITPLSEALIWLAETSVLLSDAEIVEISEASDDTWLEIDDDSPAVSCAMATVVPSHEVTPV